MINPKLHWFEVHFKYMKDNHVIFDFTEFVGHKNKADILSRRKTKARIEPLHFTPEAKQHLNNGTLRADVICYLGYMRMPK